MRGYQLAPAIGGQHIKLRSLASLSRQDIAAYPKHCLHNPRVSERVLRVELQRQLSTAILFENVKRLGDHLRLATQIAATRLGAFSQISGLSNKSECLLNGSL